MATSSLSQLNARQQSAVLILARLAAQREVRRRRQKAGIEGPLPFSTLSRLANEWLGQHPALLAEAAADPIVQNLQVSIKRRSPEIKDFRFAKVMNEMEHANDSRLRKGQH
jgi:hypothetical protein